MYAVQAICRSFIIRARVDLLIFWKVVLIDDIE